MKEMSMAVGMAVVLLFSAAVVCAQDQLTPDTAKAFLNFYYNGQGSGVVLADVNVCSAIEANECTDSVAAAALKKDLPYYLWMMYVVPKGDNVDGIIIQFNQNGLTRFTRNASVEGSIRYRVAKKFTLNNTGNWEIKILLDKGDTVETLKTLQLSVVE